MIGRRAEFRVQFPLCPQELKPYASKIRSSIYLQLIIAHPPAWKEFLVTSWGVTCHRCGYLIKPEEKCSSKSRMIPTEENHNAHGKPFIAEEGPPVNNKANPANSIQAYVGTSERVRAKDILEDRKLLARIVKRGIRTRILNLLFKI